MQWRSTGRLRALIWPLALMCLFAFLLPSSSPAQLRERPTQALSPNVVVDDSVWSIAVHTINQMALTISNRGVIGKPTNSTYEERDAFTGAIVQDGLLFPRASRRTYMDYLELWVGRSANLGPTVSSGMAAWDEFPIEGEFIPDNPPGIITRRSTTDRFGPPGSAAISEEDFICEYTDTLRLRRPGGYTFVAAPNPNALGIGVRQATYGWSMRYAEDFIIAELTFKNIGRDRQHEVFFGLHYVPIPAVTRAYIDCSFIRDQVGLRAVAPSAFGCGLFDTLNMAWNASYSGAPVDGVWLEEMRYDPLGMCFHGSTRGALGIMPLYSTVPMPHPNYNWWTVQYPPVEYRDDYDFFFFEPSQDPSVTSFLPQWQWQATDKERLRLLSTREVDYPSYLTSLMATSGYGDWSQISRDFANEVAKGPWADCLLSWGPISMFPGGEASLIFAIVGGENLHVDPNNYLNLPHRPKLYEAGLDFSDLDKNALVARWIYDNPGVDTDDDGYFGEFRVCVRDSVLVGDQWVAQKADTQWYKGDGIPDFRGALPPPAPYVWVTPVHNGLHVRFNGQVSETERDIFLQKPDFEGYRVYIGRDERVASLSVAASYDIEDYDKYRYNLSLEEPDWQLTDEPFSKDELRCLYGLTADPCNDSTFDPLLFTQMSPYRHPMYPNDSLFWFKPHDYNASTYGLSTPINKTYPDIPDPRLLPADSITEDMYTDDGYLKFYEYECTIEDILPTVSYWVNVTAFDYGSPAMGVAPMESDKSKGIIEAFPLHELDQPLSGSDNIYVFPNPYRIDINYREMGLEGRNQDDRWDERVRAIWFANLPPVCTIHIYTIDGDRVRTIEHNVPASDPTSRRHSWDLINRNYQKVESGLYYWVVEIPGDKTQIGKLALIR